MSKGLSYKQKLPTIYSHSAKPMVKNMFFPGVPGSGVPNYSTGQIYSGIINDPKNLNKWRGPVQLIRIKVDTSVWRDAVAEAERPLPSLPYRVIMQQIFIDTILNGHVSACVQKRKNLTLLKKFHICDENGVTDEEATKLLDKDWFHLMRSYIQDAQYYGYSLITFGDMIDGCFPDLQITRRADVSPDRLNLASFMYIPTGINFMEGEYYDWSLWVPTPSENGVSKCGYGLLYKVALYEIIMRSLIGWNTDYTERFGQPTTIVKTIKDSEDERQKAEEAAQKLGSSGYMILDKDDEFELIAPEGGGTGWQSYDNLEQRCKKTISAILLGHEDAISSIPGKLGSGQGEEESPVMQALEDCASVDTRFEENIINNVLLPKLIKLGINIPVGKYYRLRNDHETNEENKREATQVKAWADIALTLNQAGLKMPTDYFAEKTGMEKIEEAPKEVPSSSFSPKIKEKLNKAYAKVGCK